MEGRDGFSLALVVEVVRQNGLLWLFGSMTKHALGIFLLHCQGERAINVCQSGWGCSISHKTRRSSHKPFPREAKTTVVSFLSP
jgi:hypothetical protein